MYFPDSWPISQWLTNNTREQKWVVKAHYRVGVTKQSTLRGANHFNSAPTTTYFTHHRREILQWERNDGILILQQILR